MTIPEGDADRYRVAQIDDYAKLTRGKLPAQPPRTLSLRARASAISLPGTWGFGLWNDPFGLSVGFGGNLWQLPALPNAIWFFHASRENHLSFGDQPGNGYMAQAFHSPNFPLFRLAHAAVVFPFSRLKTRSLISDIVSEEAVRLDVDVTIWHRYRLEWSQTRSVFWVDDALVLETPVAPRPPLGLVIWIDNQYAAFTPDGKIGFGVLENKESWLEIADLDLT